MRGTAGLTERMPGLTLLRRPFGRKQQLGAAARVIAQPVGGALALPLTVLLCAYLITTLRSRVR